MLPFDEAAAEAYGPLRARLEAAGRPLDEPDPRIASIALARDLTLVTGNVRHFDRVPDLASRTGSPDSGQRQANCAIRLSLATLRR